MARSKEKGGNKDERRVLQGERGKDRLKDLVSWTLRNADREILGLIDAWAEEELEGQDLFEDFRAHATEDVIMSAHPLTVRKLRKFFVANGVVLKKGGPVNLKRFMASQLTTETKNPEGVGVVFQRNEVAKDRQDKDEVEPEDTKHDVPDNGGDGSEESSKNMLASVCDDTPSIGYLTKSLTKSAKHAYSSSRSGIEGVIRKQRKQKGSAVIGYERQQYGGPRRGNRSGDEGYLSRCQYWTTRRKDLADAMLRRVRESTLDKVLETTGI